jgi:hypothetical protein
LDVGFKEGLIGLLVGLGMGRGVDGFVTNFNCVDKLGREFDFGAGYH